MTESTDISHCSYGPQIISPENVCQLSPEAQSSPDPDIQIVQCLDLMNGHPSVTPECTTITNACFAP